MGRLEKVCLCCEECVGHDAALNRPEIAGGHMG